MCVASSQTSTNKANKAHRVRNEQWRPSMAPFGTRQTELTTAVIEKALRKTVAKSL